MKALEKGISTRMDFLDILRIRQLSRVASWSFKESRMSGRLVVTQQPRGTFLCIFHDDTGTWSGAITTRRTFCSLTDNIFH
jgi:hypothetical protein